ncbi:signal transduction protein, partial [Pleomorphomonas carboxyditropha]
MLALKLPAAPAQISPAPGEVLFVTNADLRESANVECWPVEAKYEALLEKALASLGRKARRAHPVKADKG